MAETRTQTWCGQSGRIYTYEIHTIGSRLESVPGNFIFAKREQGRWLAIYIGETADLAERFASHQVMPCVVENGATHIHARVNDAGKKARLGEDYDLIARLAPPCNRL